MRSAVRRHRRRGNQRVACGNQLEVLLRVSQGVVRHQRGHVGQLRGLGAEEFPPRRRVEEQVGYLDGGSGRQGGVIHVQNPASGNLHAGSSGSGPESGGGRGFERHPRHGCDRRQRLAAKAQRGDGKQVVGRAQLGGGVALKGQQRVVAVHAAAVVGHPDQPPPARFHIHADARGPRVQGVFQQLLHHRRRTVHHLAGGNLVGHLVRQDANAAHDCLG